MIINNWKAPFLISYHFFWGSQTHCTSCDSHISWWLSSTCWEVSPFRLYGQKYNRPLYFLSCLTNKQSLSLLVISNRFTWCCLPLAFVNPTGKIFVSSYSQTWQIYSHLNFQIYQYLLTSHGIIYQPCLWYFQIFYHFPHG